MHIAPRLVTRGRRLSRVLTTLLATIALVAGGATATQAAPAGSPRGNLDGVTVTPTGVTVRGWAWDSSTSASVTVRVTVSGTSTLVKADEYRPDVAKAFPKAGAYRGFNDPVPARPGTHQVCVVAVNVGAGADTSLGCRTVTVLDHAPVGALDAATVSPEGVQLNGWAADRDATSPLTVRVTAGTTSVTLTTGATRPDVTAVHPWAPATSGFGTVLTGLPVGPVQLCATVVNVGPGADLALPCRTVEVPAPPAAPVTTTRPSGTPGPDTTGVPAGVALTVHTGDLVVTTPGAVIDGLDVHGFVTVKAPGVVIRNSVIRGRATTTQRALVSASLDTASVTIEDSELFAAHPSGWIDGIRGWNITARRVDIHHVIDAVHIYGPNVTIEDSWLHDNLHYTSDPAQNGGASHDDSIQIQKGSNIRIRNNHISGAFNTGIQFTQDQGIVSDVQVTGNFADGGGCTVNFAEKGRGPFQGVVVSDNTFGRTTKHLNCAIIAPDTTRAVLTTANNFFTDGVAATVRRG